MTCVLGVLMRLHDLAHYGYPRRRLRQRQLSMSTFWSSSRLPFPYPPRLGPCHHSWPPEPPASTFAAFALKPSVSGPFTSPVSVSSAPFEHQYFIFLILSLIYIPLFSPRSVAIASHDIYNMHTATRHLIYLFIIHNKPSLSSVLSFHRQKRCTLIHAHTRRDIYI